MPHPCLKHINRDRYNRSEQVGCTVRNEEKGKTQNHDVRQDLSDGIRQDSSDGMRQDSSDGRFTELPVS